MNDRFDVHAAWAEALEDNVLADHLDRWRLESPHRRRYIFDTAHHDALIREAARRIREYGAGPKAFRR